MRPDEYNIVFDKAYVGTSRPTITATRLKGDPIMETRQVQVGTKPGKVLLELTPRAAETLMIIGQYIGGDPRTTRRGDVADILCALDSVKVFLPLDFRNAVKDGYPGSPRRFDLGLTFQSSAA